ncbi:MAG: ABC transporter permease [Paludibacteraceae bacterium]|nr:ABC transporter permease [Paludibacteraceae bacterium]
MRNEWLIARRLYSEDNPEKGKRMSTPAVKVALAGIIIGIAVMVTTVFIVVGFKRTITDKVVGFGSHIQVVNFDNNNTYEMQPVYVSDTLLDKLRNIKYVTSAEVFATKPGILKTDSQFQAVIFKGMPLEAKQNRDFFSRNLTSGQMPEKNNEILISDQTSRRLKLKKDSTVLCYFIQDNIMVRKYTISGTYRTDFSDYDELFIIGDIGQVQRLNQWKNDQVSGVEILISDFGKIEEATNSVYFATANQADRDGNFFMTQNVIQLNPAIFSWLDLLDMNVLVIILLMLAVSGFNIISGLLILILDSIRFIGTMKSLGADDRFLRRIYLMQAAILIGKGMLIGNLIALSLCTLQYFFHIVPLDPTAYYVSYVPVSFHWGWWSVVNIGTLLVSLLILLAPSAIVTRISPSKVMQFE